MKESHVQDIIDHFQKQSLQAYSISFGAALLYNNIFPKHKERLGQKLSDLTKTVAKVDLPPWRKYFDVVVACEDDDGEDVDIPLISISYK
jgi:ubiquitin-activating enzyme E1